MTAREYLSQAYCLDKSIENRLEQLASLKRLATKTTTILEGDMVSHTRNVARLQDTIARMIDMEEEINAEIDRLVDLKEEIRRVILAVPDPEAQILLEMRYLSFRTWKEIAERLGYNVRHIYRMHDRALEELRIPKEPQNRAESFVWHRPDRANSDD